MRRPLPPTAQHPGPAKEFPLRVGISSCLLGEEVRWDGSHKRNGFIADLLSRYVQVVPVCPELEVGMGVPREPVRLVGAHAAPRMVGVRSGRDWTAAMRRYASARIRHLNGLDLSGYLLKKDSPSCGMERVLVHSGKGAPSRKGVGLFASELRLQMPLLPLEEEGRLEDPALRENFIERVFAYRRLRDLLDSPCRRGDLVAFHMAHEYLLLSHSPRHYQELGRLLAAAKSHTGKRLGHLYGEGFMEALRFPATLARHFNVLQHAAGYLKEVLDASEKRHLQKVLDDYRRSLVPLIVPVTLLHHHVMRQRIEFMQNQIYLHPHPKELMLRNHA
ncbi:MAG: DUF523 and DUF1722 domain-containing protein [Acidobacteria bacterium]|nr:DUF523 and DUF1722 domain-containing protein [Acidobacteriota bacterium]